MMMHRLLIFTAAILQLAACADEPGQITASCDTAPINRTQQIGSHNSYRVRPPPSVLEEIERQRSGFREKIEYEHPTLDRQLDLGLRLLEIDIYADPEGGRFAAPPNLALLRPGEPRPFSAEEMDQPGFKVMHMQGYDNYSTCLTLEACFSVLADWSRQNPGHALITVTLNLKDDQPFPGTSPAVPFDNRLLDEMDRLIAALFERETVFTPDDLRGAAPSLKLAVRQNRWPTRSETRGQFMFVIDEETPSAMLRYREGHPSLRGRMMWATFPETEEEAAFINIWNIRGQEARARALVEDGFLVRTAADIGTAEARRGDRTRLDAAIESGAQFIATDFYPGHISDIPTDYIASFKDQNLVQCPDL